MFVHWLLIGILVGFGLVFSAGFGSLFTRGRFARGRRRPLPFGAHALIGRQATVRSALEPTGYVAIQGESWKARLIEGRAEPGETVTVVGMRGLELDVRRTDTDAMPATSKSLRRRR